MEASPSQKPMVKKKPTVKKQTTALAGKAQKMVALNAGGGKVSTGGGGGSTGGGGGSTGGKSAAALLS